VQYEEERRSLKGGEDEGGGYHQDTRVYSTRIKFSEVLPFPGTMKFPQNFHPTPISEISGA
jgi:hypothetical protein